MGRATSGGLRRTRPKQCTDNPLCLDSEASSPNFLGLGIRLRFSPAATEEGTVTLALEKCLLLGPSDPSQRHGVYPSCIGTVTRILLSNSRERPKPITPVCLKVTNQERDDR